MITLLADTKASVNLTEENGATPVYIASQKGHPDAIMALVAAKASIDQQKHDGTPPIGIAAQAFSDPAKPGSHDEVVALLAHLGAALYDGDGDGFWAYYTPETRINKGRGELAREFWPRIASECPDDGTEESLTKRRAMLKAAKIYDPR